MDLVKKANYEIEKSAPIFELLLNHQISEKLRLLLIEEAPKEFFSVLTQIARHAYNGNLKVECKKFFKLYKSALFVFCYPDTTIAEKQLILKEESPKFIYELYNCFKSNVVLKK